MSEKIRPPFVRFEARAVEDRNASIEAGLPVSKDVDFALITPVGSKDMVEHQVDDWLKRCEAQVAEGRMPLEWLSGFRVQYQYWKDGQEAPIDGMPIKDWPGVTPSQLKSLQAVHIRSVQELSEANEETLHRLGMGGRELKARAVAYLKAANDIGKTAERVAALEVENTALKARDVERDARLAALESQLAALTLKK